MGLSIELDYERGVPIYRQIVEAIATQLDAGQIAAAEKLPTIHDLARQLDVNPNTVARAYRELEHEGYLVAERGRGTFPAVRRQKPSRALALKGIVAQALAECERQRFSPKELLACLLKELS